MFGRKYYRTVIIPTFLAIIILLSFILLDISGNFSVVNAQELSKDIKSKNIKVEELTEKFISSNINFSISLFKGSRSQSKNSLISPVSVSLALGMTANGSDGNTLLQFKKLIGEDKFSIDQLNKFNYSMSLILQNNNENKIRLANSIWYRDQKDLIVNPVFLQRNADFYKAAVYKSDFNSSRTVKDINNWVKRNTDGMIDNMVETIDPNTIMYLFNTVLFESEWANIYKSNEVYDEIFSRSEQDNIGVPFMHSLEKYLKGKNAEGFIKPYKGDKFSFVGILPNENISVDEYLKTFDGKNFFELMNSFKDEYAQIGIPKFKFEYSISLVDPLKKLGLTDGFIPSKANFTKMATDVKGNIFIADVLHKTYIQVDEKGTKAGAATKVEMATKGAMQQPRKVTFDRPFVFVIIENNTKLPLFIGSVTDPAVK